MSDHLRDVVFLDVEAERLAQDARWGVQNHPNGTAYPLDGIVADNARFDCEQAFADGAGTWRHILTEEFHEAMAESDPVRLRAELVQLVAVAVAWVECIDRRRAARSSKHGTGH